MTESEISLAPDELLEEASTRSGGLTDLGEFLLPYEAVRSAADPEQTLMSFLQSTYDAAADLAHWDRGALDCAPGRPRVPRSID